MANELRIFLRRKILLVFIYNVFEGVNNFVGDDAGAVMFFELLVELLYFLLGLVLVLTSKKVVRVPATDCCKGNAMSGRNVTENVFSCHLWEALCIT